MIIPYVNTDDWEYLRYYSWGTTKTPGMVFDIGSNYLLLVLVTGELVRLPLSQSALILAERR